MVIKLERRQARPLNTCQNSPSLLSVPNQLQCSFVLDSLRLNGHMCV